MNLNDVVLSKVYKASLADLQLSNRCVINTINPHSYCVAKKDDVFDRSLYQSDVLLPDGIGIVLATKILTGKKIEKIAGADIHQHLLEQANLKGHKVFYLGATQNTLSLIEKRIQKEYPNIKVASFSPPFVPEFSEEENSEMVKRLNDFNPDILFVGMTAPKQEKWVFTNKAHLNAKTIVSIGAVFDFYAGTEKRSGDFWIKLGLEWLPRLVRNPKRLWKRNFVSTPKFLLEIFKTKVQSAVHKKQGDLVVQK